jgi:hypothetical protein
MSADDKLVEAVFEREAKSIYETNLDQYDKWFAERGIETQRAHWKGRAEASEAKIAALTAENATLREKVERAAEDERDRLYAEFETSFGEEVYQIRGAAMWAGEVLRRKGAMLPSEREARRQEGKP